MSGPIDKRRVLDAVLAAVRADLEAVTASQQQTQAGATHEDARPENDKDTRALESTYLARGLAQRVADLRAAASALATLALRAFDDDTPIALTAMVALEAASGDCEHYFLAPSAGGVRVVVDGAAVAVITPNAPLARALAGKRTDDEVAVRDRVLTIAAVW